MALSLLLRRHAWYWSFGSVSALAHTIYVVLLYYTTPKHTSLRLPLGSSETALAVAKLGV